jgi:hypothetical protein
MSESVVLCEGYHDRAFWDGWLKHLGCSSQGFEPSTPGYPALDPWGDKVGGGQFAYYSPTQRFVRVRPCNGKSNILRELRIRLVLRSTKVLESLVINVDVDTSTTSTSQTSTGLRRQDVLNQVQHVDASAMMNASGEVELDGGATKIYLLRWEAADPPAPGLPDQQTLERLVSAAMVAAYPARATAVQTWLDARPSPPGADPKEHAWSYMAGWYAQYGCEAFNKQLWDDPRLADELKGRLQASGAWQIAAALAS